MEIIVAAFIEVHCYLNIAVAILKPRCRVGA